MESTTQNKALDMCLGPVYVRWTMEDNEGLSVCGHLKIKQNMILFADLVNAVFFCLHPPNKHFLCKRRTTNNIGCGIEVLIDDQRQCLTERNL